MRKLSFRGDRTADAILRVERSAVLGVITAAPETKAQQKDCGHGDQQQ
jgi:hypothetical protein